MKSMDLALNGKVALVTAASRGLGYGCAVALAQQGARVVICSRDRERIEDAAAAISKEAGGDVTGIRADLTVEEDLHRLVTTTEGVLGPIDILVMSTGNPPSGCSSEVTDSDWARGYALCLGGPIVLCRKILPRMRARRFGRIVFLSSVFAVEPHEGYVISSTLRPGISSFAKCLAREAGPDGVCVNVVCPGYVDTPLLRELAQQNAGASGKTSQEVLLEWANAAPVRRLGRQNELGSLVLFLCSPQGGFMNGSSIVWDGGLARA